MLKFFTALLCLIVSLAHSQSMELVNTPYDEYNPVATPDMKVLYFTRAHHPHNVGGQKDKGDIWYSKRLENGSWGPAVHAGKEINSTGINSVLGFNKEGTAIYLNNHYSESGMPKTQGISVSNKIGAEWSKPVNLFIPYFKNLSAQQSGWVSDDGSIVLISAENYNTRGAEDLYVILQNTDGSWRDARNLGNILNTKFQEFSPYYDPIDSTLYFSSNGHGGRGSSDVFFSKRLDETWDNWSPPLPLGDSVNTEGKEIGLSDHKDHEILLFSSTLNSDGYGDIKIHRYGDQGIQQSKDKKLFVINEKTGDILSSEIEITASDGKTILIESAITGASIEDFAPGNYTIVVTAPGYIILEQPFTITADQNEYLISLQPISGGTRVVLNNVLFAQSTDNLLPESYKQLDHVVRLMNENPELMIRLEGHTDNRGSEKANVRLSKMRAEAVAEYLINKGISKRRISEKGYGGEHPLYPNDSEENRRRNRRVEFVIED